MKIFKLFIFIIFCDVNVYAVDPLQAVRQLYEAVLSTNQPTAVQEANIFVPDADTAAFRQRLCLIYPKYKVYAAPILQFLRDNKKLIMADNVKSMEVIFVSVVPVKYARLSDMNLRMPEYIIVTSVDKKMKQLERVFIEIEPQTKKIDPGAITVAVPDNADRLCSFIEKEAQRINAPPYEMKGRGTVGTGASP